MTDKRIRLERDMLFRLLPGDIDYATILTRTTVKSARTQHQRWGKCHDVNSSTA